MPARVLLQDFTGVPAVVDLAAMRDAMADLGGDPGAHQPAGARRPGDRPLGPGRPLPHGRRLRLQRGPRVRAQRRALPAAALGADGVPRPARRAARHGHRPPGQPRVPRARSWSTARDDGRPGRLPRHARGHRLAHDDGQRPRRAGLRRGRHRGGGRAARPAALPAHAPRRRACDSTASCRAARPPRTWCWWSARCCAGTASWARSWSSPATGWPRWRWPTGPPSPTCRPSTARRPRSSPSTTRR